MSEKNKQVVIEQEEVQEEGQLQISKGMILAVTEDGRLVHEFIGKDGANIIEMEGLLEYGRRVIEQKWEEIL